MARIRKNDTVEVIAGADTGKRGRVLQVLPEKGRVLVEGVHYVQRHVRPSQRNPRGGRLEKELPVDISNVMLVCPHCNKPVRVRRDRSQKGRVRRICRTCGDSLDR